ncbi:MAG: hypothetical protein GY778_29500, partial [bacterium]|nr:hypothetical protein [bacterium]
GAPHHWSGGARGGSALVYLRNDEGTPDDASDDTWEHQATLIASDPLYDAEFGDSVAIDGDTIVVGAPGYGEPWFRSSGAALGLCMSQESQCAF